MKLFTLNAHSLLETDTPKAREALLRFLVQERPDVIALQEANQSRNAPFVGPNPHKTAGGMSIKEDNYCMWLANHLDLLGWPVYWVWHGFKHSWEHLEEGVGLLSPHKLEDVCEVQLSETALVDNWRTRFALGATIAVDGHNERVYTCQFGWTDDAEEPFVAQFARGNKAFSPQSDSLRTWLLGDFNVDANTDTATTHLIRSSGWHDMAVLAHAEENTAPPKLDGWLERGGNVGKRIDYVFSNERIKPFRSEVHFSGERESEPRVSDHFGLLVEV